MEKWKANKINYNNQYNKDSYFNVAIRIRKDNTEVINKLNSVKSKNAYIIDLIEQDIKRNGWRLNQSFYSILYIIKYATKKNKKMIEDPIVSI